jgi:hypothetical protein
MKQINFFVPILRLAIGALLIASANPSVSARDRNSSNPSGAIFATGAADGGRLFIQRSPVLGDNAAIALMIDGQVAGTLVQGHTYDRYITPGRHILTATPSGLGGESRTVLDVRRGETYSYTAAYTVNTLVLTSTTGSR